MNGYAVEYWPETKLVKTFKWIENKNEITDNEVFSSQAPHACDEKPKTVETVTAEVLLERDRLLSICSLKIAPLQYAEDLGDQTEQEKKKIELWKAFSRDVNRITQQPSFPFEVSWPEMPGEL